MKVIKGTMASPKGFYADGKHVGLKRKRKDIGWIFSEVKASAAAVYTTNQIQAAPIQVTKNAFKQSDTLQAIVVNSGSANACTGSRGLEDATYMQNFAATQLGIQNEEVAVCSTGVIGEYLDLDKITDGISRLRLQHGQASDFEEAILTTDTKKKQITIQETIDGKCVTMSGVAKGSGMIHPNMATMLAFVTTDATISSENLQLLVKKLVDETFNQITVDGDTSTNDTVIVMANGLAENKSLVEEHPEFSKFKAMLRLVFEHLAKAIASDGEGATKLIEVAVKGATSALDARMIAKKIVSSSLVKTAMFGGDANWGRIICAIGYSGGRFAPDYISISAGPYQILNKSEACIYSEEGLRTYLNETDVIRIEADLHVGLETGLAWGCDLSYDYVKINACYRT
ncbi:bifunctional glutamate N-acetyltransferase/amino-acid acetyltransferase ArgJ [Listeria fleischmannii]|jgi:glutamate N-acetyltransferase/amino-acid N-acetyltransferase|uniref:bifunctional glutamate N-acetyltransferase/amino-acid acetyltransferase ArgJ n=1 Tax=Listeria fleischmannii TaxID=1069827 RepID=UPI00162700D8|nr:bifunctional glutamate N-acetyltransferase/amino-acid acetyltransferase ArgJ [Listeria fleischmannii]MBC1418352.1 bifunctional glutamate N-acetyltransferase/amino-acid acetyltransferase ArgJ [Listeria fleischmannii]